MPDEPKEEKKIIIDEDWKSQVEAEREQAEHPVEEPAPEAEPDWPEPSLSFLITTLATQAMVAMGIVTHPAIEKSEVQLGQAKHFIDTIELLKEKTEGNRTSEETDMFDHVLYELRMGFVAVQGQQEKSG